MYFVVTEVCFEKEVRLYELHFQESWLNVCPSFAFLKRREKYLQLNQDMDLYFSCNNYTRIMTQYMPLYAPDICEA